jgi:hydrogenase expression/formation protein HypE
MTMPPDVNGWTCPVSEAAPAQILLAHGGGGSLMHCLIEQVFMAAFRNPALDTRHDGAVLEVGGQRLAFTTDSFVVSPYRFPGGTIGDLAVNGTVNDLAMCGASPLALSAGFILEEGLPMAALEEVTRAMQRAAAAAGVPIVTGDTKVVDRGKGDGLFINTAGVGLIRPGVRIEPRRIQPGDRLLLSGDVGRHGMAVMSVREGLTFEPPIESDTAPLHGPVAALLDAGIDVHCLRDLTRGGLASVLVELAGAARVPLTIEEAAVPVREDVRGACELLGLDPLYVANEGRFLAVVPPGQAREALAIVRRHPVGQEAADIGAVIGPVPGQISLTSVLGTTRLLDLPSGDQLPRIC